MKKNRLKYDEKKGPQPRGLFVEVRNNNVDKALRILKKKLQEDGLFQDLREREYHMTRGEKRRRDAASGKRRQEKNLQKRMEELGY